MKSFTQKERLIGFALLLLLTTLACAVPSFSTPKGPPATPTPMGNTLTLNVPVYEETLAPGESVPGTRLEYVGKNGNTYDVRIDGLPANKKLGDSFLWGGTIAPGVFANYKLRLGTELLGQLPTAGPVELLIFNPVPIEVETIPTENVQLHFGLIAVKYQMPPGFQIPGSTLTYVGTKMQAGSELAELSGLSGYPLLATGDSLVWSGRLLDNVYIRYDLRVFEINEYGLTLIGTADLWITP